MRILLAEDDAVTRGLLEAMLRQDGHEVTAAADGDAAWESFMAAPVPLVVLDWQMPGMDGLALCRRIRELPEGQSTFVLMLTGRDGSDDLAMAIDAGVDDYVVKPVTRDHLRVRVSIAERRLKSDAARRAAERALEELRWESGVNQTIIAVQHEINNPLAALLAILELAADDAAPPEEHPESLRLALVQTRRIADVMRRISSIPRHRSVEYVAGVPMIDISRQE